MSVFSTVTGYLIGLFRGGSIDVAIHESVSGAKPQTSMSCFAPGLEINPADGENLVLTRIGKSNSFVVSIGGTNQNIEPTTERGERKLYSVSEDGLELKASLLLKNDGSIELSNEVSAVTLDLEGNFGIANDNGSISLDLDGNIDLVNASGAYGLDDAGVHTFNGGPEAAVLFSKLKIAYDQLKGDFDSFVSSTYGTHTHIVTTPDTINGTAAPTLAQGVPSTGNIDPAESTEVLIS